MNRRAIAWVLASSMFSMSLAGCGAPATQVAGTEPTGTMQASAYSGAQLARIFADQLEAQTGQRPIVRGDRVILRTADGGQAVYDLSRTAATGKVVFRAGEAETAFEWNPGEEISAKAIPPILVAIAVKMVWGGTKAFLKYWIKHRGDDFNKKDCVKVVVYGMVAEGLTAIPVVGGVLASLLWPIAWKWVEKWLDKNLPWEARSLLESGMEFKEEIALALQEAIELSR